MAISVSDPSQYTKWFHLEIFLRFFKQRERLNALDVCDLDSLDRAESLRRLEHVRRLACRRVGDSSGNSPLMPCISLETRRLVLNVTKLAPSSPWWKCHFSDSQN